MGDFGRVRGILRYPMPCPNRKQPGDKSSPCVWYVKGGFCSRDDIFRCIEYIEHKEVVISHSQVQSFLRCKYKWYIEQIMGYEPIPAMKSTALKMGSDAHQAILPLFSRSDIKPQEQELNPSDQWEYLEIVKIEAIKNAIEELGINIPQGMGEHGFIVQRDGCPRITGKLDVAEPSKGWFIELKYTTKPQGYLHPTMMKAQMGTYFLSDDRYERGYIKAIQVPQLRLGKGETPEKYGERLYEDILRRPAFYFPNYDKETKMWGNVLFRRECNLPEIVQRYVWIVDELRDSLRKNSFYRNETACFNPYQCEFFSACESGGFSETMYRHRERRNEPKV